MSADDPPVQPIELAQALHRFSRVGTRQKGPEPWDDLSGLERDRYILTARLSLDHLSGRRITDPQRVAISRLQSAAHAIAKDAGSAVEEALRNLDLDVETVQRDAHTAGVAWAAQELDRLGWVDLAGGTSDLDEALRRLVREGGPHDPV